MAVLETTELYRFFHAGDEEVMALRGVTIKLEVGAFTALQGPSGSGKSTLIACLAGIDEPDGGMVSVLGERLTRRPEPERARLRARHFGVLMQSGNLFEHLTVANNIRLQSQIGGSGQSAEIDGLLDSLITVGLVGGQEGAGGPECGFAGGRPPREIRHARQLLKPGLWQPLQAMHEGIEERPENARPLLFEVRERFLLKLTAILWDWLQGSDTFCSLAMVPALKATGIRQNTTGSGASAAS